VADHPDRLEVSADIVALAAASHPEGIAWRNLDDDAELPLGEWDGDANRMARGLRSAGVLPGDRVVLDVGPDDPLPWLVTYVGVHRAGAVAVPVNTRLAAPELRAVVRHADAVVIVTAGGAPAHGVVAGTATGATVSRPDRDEEAGPPRLHWTAVLDVDPTPLPEQPGAADPIDVLYTSGTTSAPKAVLARGGAGPAGGRPPRWNGLGFMTCSPFATTSGILLVDGPLRIGMSGWYLPRFDAGRWLDLVERHRPVAAFLVPAMAQLLVAHPGFGDADLTSLAALTFGGAPMARATLRRLVERLPGADVLVGYGLTEFGAVSRTPSGDGGRHLGSVGQPLDGVEVRVVDVDGTTLAPGAVGEITVRGAGPPRRYFKDEPATERLWRDGWLHTGDLGHLDEDGFLWITGRAKDVIIRGGNNIVPRDVEEVLLSHPEVVDAVVLGIPHAVLGEDVATWIVLRDDSAATGDDLRQFMLDQLADYKVPRAVHLVGELPRNASGKVVRASLVGQAPAVPPAEPIGESAP
jgi:long-chain acyl-CoA synthetase